MIDQQKKPTNKKRKLVILVGNIGSGKSTLCKQLTKEKYVILSRDALRYMIGAGLYHFNLKTEPAIADANLLVLESFLNHGLDIVMDETNMTKRSRAKIIERAKKYSYHVIVIILPILKRQESVDRRMKNPHNQADRKLWLHVWDMFNHMYQEPSKKEGIDEIIKL